jgi:hypothetical protein
MIEATASNAIATALASNRIQAGMVGLRANAQAENQMAALLAQNTAPTANPAHLGSQIDTYA